MDNYNKGFFIAMQKHYDEKPVEFDINAVYRAAQAQGKTGGVMAIHEKRKTRTELLSISAYTKDMYTRLNDR